MKLNDTTRTYPRTMQDAFPNTVYANERLQTGAWYEGHQSPELTFQDAQFWVYIVCSFAAGFLVHTLWG